MSSCILSIDIQQEHISSVLMAANGLKGIRIVETACFEIVQDNPDTDYIEETAENNFFHAVLNSLEKNSAKISGAHDRCIISIPSHFFSFRSLEMPFKNRKKNSRILAFELEDHLPWPVEDCESAFCMLDKNSKYHFKKKFAVVASIRKTHMNKFMEIFDKCNIYPDLVTVGSGYAEALAYAGISDQSDCSFFVHVEPLLSSIYVVNSGEIALIRTFSLNFTDWSDSVQSVKTNLIHTILSFNELFNKPMVKKKVKLDKIVVSGTALFRQKLCDEIEEQINIPVSDFNIIDAARIIIPAQKYPSVQNAIAMGVNEIKGVNTYNFSRDVSDFAMFYQENQVNIIAAAVLCCIFFLTWAINPIMKINHMEKTAAKLDNRIVQVFKSCFPDVKNIVDPVHQMKINVDALQKKKEINFFDEYPLCIDLLNDISRALPPLLDISLSRFVRTENSLFITGSADQFNTVDKMKNNLKNVSSFKEVYIKSASMDKAAKRVKFKLKISLKSTK